MTRTNSMTPEMLIPDVVTRYPPTRAVFDRYGLQGCGGAHGPHETVNWFARLHGVALSSLPFELAEATSTGAPAIKQQRSIVDAIYRPFFIAGLATVLTLGCVWGAINLLAIGLNKNFSTISYSWILAHGHAMVFLLKHGFEPLGIRSCGKPWPGLFRSSRLAGAKVSIWIVYCRICVSCYHWRRQSALEQHRSQINFIQGRCRYESSNCRRWFAIQ